jgi:DnaJ-class molecular chaperone
MEDCKVCDGMGYFDADFDYDAGRYVPYGDPCEDCDGTGKSINGSGEEL